ncbi:class I SAM-dependent methyltransferase [Saccharothrix variisporea]|uniref:Ubiquinone/menaquinone biosynthesis C-methylase UbiE n=1 Tax=Saccharothrix variisporea TaxID=543527 RepID=A0A495X3T3_9PSEU|nr:class I SAM-dependent methyltransferase [Saccharothrix variisporea]RKT68169.1 ubiquinone/menaquinone biosynthesis C-methylase UbiE [Saccharothrix variisporea]
MTTLDRSTAAALRRGWDAQQQPFLPWREEVFDVLAARARDRVLDLAGGTGSIASRLTDVTLLDFDPVLLEIARVALDVPVVRADLSGPGWADGLPRFDSVLAGTALHHFGPDRLRALYAEIRDLLNPGGLFANADRMPEPAAVVPGEPGAMEAWHDWWREALAHPALAALADRPDGESADFYPPVSWHVDALRAAGFAHVEVVWRRGDSAVVVAQRDPGRGPEEAA